MKKIIIFGFPHCGTTILKKIICHIPGVLEIDDEVNHINENCINQEKCINKNFFLCKWPYLINVNENKYKDYIKIFIIRNPLFVFSSLNERFDYKMNTPHSIDTYIKTIHSFVECKKNIDKHDNLYLIRYEDMFDNNFKLLKQIFTKIGFEYTDEIFDNTKYENYAQGHKNFKIPTKKPTNKEHHIYRLFQINQEFTNNNDIKKINLLEDQLEKLKKNEDIQSIYPDILHH